MEFDKSKTFFGIIVITFGVILLLNNFGHLQINPLELILTYWPTLVIAWGLQALWTGSKNRTAQFTCLFIIASGLVLLANNLNLLAINLAQILKVGFPVLIILIGFSIFTGKTMVGKSTLAILGGVDRGKNSTWQLETGSYIAFMGGIDLDLRHAVIPPGETVLDLTAVMGGIDIRVPADLPVVADGFAVLGGVDVLGKGSGGIIGSLHHEHATTADNTSLLRIEARAIMGGIEIKRV